MNRIRGSFEAKWGDGVAVRPIRLFGDPVLRTRAAPVIDFDKELRALVSDMIETMRGASGVGLAANQIGVGLRVFTYEIENDVGHVVNPHLTLSGEEDEWEEGCLSVPGVVATTRRARTAGVSGRDMHGDQVRIEGTGLLARCLQHEVDHLNGLIFIDRLEPEGRKVAMRQIRATAWFGSDSQGISADADGMAQWH